MSVGLGPNTVLLLFHIAAGGVGLASGAVALSAAKGGRLHRKSGIVFVYSMCVMAAIGGSLASVTHFAIGGELIEPKRLSVIAGGLSLYLVTTALLAVRPRGARSVWIDAGQFVFAIAVGGLSLKWGIDALRSPSGSQDGLPAVPALIFGAVALLAGMGDLRALLARGLEGAQRTARHLWRMCFALSIAAASFFLGQASLFPEAVRNPLLLGIPVLLVLALMLYWLLRLLFTSWRLRARPAAPALSAGST